MSRPCPSCGASPGDSARFCPSCGTVLGAPEAASRDATLLDGAPTVAVGPARPSALATSAPSSRGLRGRADEAGFVPGAILAGRYRIVALAGRGGMGEVYRADDLTLGEPVALKFLPPHLSADPVRLARFRAEVSLARQVSHPNVCRVYDIAEIDGHHFLSMEYVDGEDLASLLRRIGRVPQDKGLEMARQLAAGLAAAHDLGVVHRDLKPGNVMVDGRGRVRIADFGLAAAVEAPDAHDFAGTPAYMAPEQFEGRPASVSSDIYALGLVLYELFTGKAAFTGATVADLARQHREHTPSGMSTIIGDLDPAVERAISRCLEKDPGARPASALAVTASLPGGDPLAAALARGETPSPELVAASGESGTLDARMAALALAGVGLGLLAVVLLAARVHVALLTPLPRSPDVLGDRAREMAASVGFTAAPGDTSSGFALSDYLPRVRGESMAARREHFRSGEPPVVLFWYRQSPAILAAGTFGSAARVGPRDPPLTRPGMLSIVLDPAGRLRELRSVPAATAGPAPGGTASPDWPGLLRHAGFDPGRFEAVPPRLTPPVYADERAAWQGTYPSRPDVAIRVEAAALGGRPVFFRIVEPWNEPAAGEPAAPAGNGWFMDVVLPLTFLGLLATAVLLAARNLRAGRGDRRGAARVTGLLLALALAGGLLGADHAPGFGPFLNVLLLVLGQALTMSLAVCAAYLALEPYVRRRWPHALIGWSRLLAGRWQDPRVGRDVFAGVAIGIGMQLVFQAAQLLATGQVGSAPVFWMLDGSRFAASWLMSTLSSALLLSLGIVLLLFLLALVVRRLSVAAVCVTLFFGASAALGGEGSPLAAGVFNTLAVGTLLLGLFRFGLLTLVAAIFVNNTIDTYPLTFDVSRWFAPFGFLIMAIVFGLALHGAWRAAAMKGAMARLLDR